MHAYENKTKKLSKKWLKLKTTEQHIIILLCPRKATAENPASTLALLGSQAPHNLSSVDYAKRQ